MSDAPSRQQPQQQLHLHGPRPLPLKLTTESHKIRKQQKPAPPKSRHHHPPPPLIIYTVSPKPIHVDPHNFMSLVQHLTGSNSSSSSASSSSSSTLLNTATTLPSPYSANGGGEWRETQFIDGGGSSVEIPQSSLCWHEENDSNPLSYLNDHHLHGSSSNNNIIINMTSSTAPDVYNYSRHII